MPRRKLLLLGLVPVFLSCSATEATDKILFEKKSPYNTVVVTEDDRGLRTLWFDRGGVRQSVVKVGDPDHLELRYARVMPVGLALVDQPRRVLIVGLGGIGTQAARRAHGLGMRVIATRGSRREGPDYVEYVGLADETIELAKQADVIINTTPLTDRTRGMFDAGFFATMKPTAYFISVGRGGSTVSDYFVSPNSAA